MVCAGQLVLCLKCVSSARQLIGTAAAEVEDFYQACDPEKENLCLYGG